MKDANVSMFSFKLDYNTWKGQRFKVHFLTPDSGEDRLVKVELSFRK